MKAMFLLVAAVLLCLAPAHAADPSATRGAVLEEAVRKSLDLPAHVPVEFHSKTGRKMDRDAFAKLAADPHNSIAIDKSSADKLVLRLRKSQAPAKTKNLTHMPELEARDLTGRLVRNVDLAGKHTLLSFYFSTCAPCIQEVPALNAYRAAHPELNYLAVTFDPAADARKFVSDRKLNWPVVAGAARFLKAAGVRSFPGYMLVGPDGRIMGRGAGLAIHAQEVTPGLAALEKFVDTQLKDQK